MKKFLFSLVILLFLLVGFRTFAQESPPIQEPAGVGGGYSPVITDTIKLPDPGITPDSPFYFLKSWKESIQTFFTFGEENKAKQFLHLAEVRLAEYQKIIEKGKTEIAEKTLEKYESQLNRALEKVKELENKGKDIKNISEEIKTATSKHIEMLQKNIEKAPEAAKEGLENAIENSQKVLYDVYKKPVNKCNENSDCILFYTGDQECAPCELSHEDFKCVSKEEAEKIRQEQIEKNRLIACNPCPAPKIDFECTCNNGNCIKVKKQDSQEKQICIQVITPAVGPDGKCKEFPTPCEVPTEWKKVEKCAVSPTPIKTPAISPTPTPTPKPTPTPTPTPTKSPATCPQATSFEQLIPAVSPDGTCRKFMSECTIPTDWKKVSSCPPMTFTREMTGCCVKGVNICAAKPRYDCLSQGGREVPTSTCDIANICFYLADEPKMIIMTPGGVVSPTPMPEPCPQTATLAVGPDGTCKEFPTPCHVYVGWKKVSECPGPPDYISCNKGGTQDHKCLNGTAVNWQCQCLNIVPQATAYWNWKCVLEPVKFCPASNTSAQPNISEIEIRHYGGSIQIFWRTNIPTLTYMEYGPTTSYGSRAGGLTGAVGSLDTPGTYFVVEGQHLPIGLDSNAKLKPDTLYHFKIIADDTKGNIFTSQDYTFTTAL